MKRINLDHALFITPVANFSSADLDSGIAKLKELIEKERMKNNVYTERLTQLQKIRSQKQKDKDLSQAQELRAQLG